MLPENQIKTLKLKTDFKWPLKVWKSSSYFPKPDLRFKVTIKTIKVTITSAVFM